MNQSSDIPDPESLADDLLAGDDVIAEEAQDVVAEEVVDVAVDEVVDFK